MTSEIVKTAGITVRFRVEPDAWLPIEALTQMGHPYNSQVRTGEDEEAIWASIEERGYLGEPILVNDWNQKIIAGHGRVKVLYDHGYRGDLPVCYETYETEVKHRMAMLRANMARGHQDADKLEAELMFIRQSVTSAAIERALGLEADSLEQDAEAMMAEADAAETPDADETVDLEQEGVCGVVLPGWNEISELSFLSVRRWVKARRADEVAWFARHRLIDDPVLAGQAALEIADRLEPLVGHANLPLWVTTPPAARPRSQHFVAQLASAVAEDLGIPYTPVFDDWPTTQTSAREEGSATLRTEPPAGLCLLIDDFAMTGKTLAAAIYTLRRRQMAVLPVVWIFGEAAYGRPNR